MLLYTAILYFLINYIYLTALVTLQIKIFAHMKSL